MICHIQIKPITSGREWKPSIEKSPLKNCVFDIFAQSLGENVLWFWKKKHTKTFRCSFYANLFCNSHVLRTCSHFMLSLQLNPKPPDLSPPMTPVGPVIFWHAGIRDTYLNYNYYFNFTHLLPPPCWWRPWWHFLYHIAIFGFHRGEKPTDGKGLQWNKNNLRKTEYVSVLHHSRETRQSSMTPVWISTVAYWTGLKVDSANLASSISKSAKMQ